MLFQKNIIKKYLSMLQLELTTTAWTRKTSGKSILTTIQQHAENLPAR